MQDNNGQIDETIAAFKKLGDKADATIDRFLIKGAKVLQSEAKSNVYRVLKRRSGKLQENIKIGDIRDGSKGKSIVVGTDKGDRSESFYGKFAEYGTSRQKAKPWLRPAMIAKEDELEKMFYDEIDKALKEWGNQSK